MRLDFVATYIALWILVVFQGLLILALLKQLTTIRRLAERASPLGDKLPLGSSAPEFMGTDLQFAGWNDADSLGVVILFLTAGCPACQELLNSIGQHGDNVVPHIVAVCQGGDACSKRVANLSSAIQLAACNGEETARQYRISRFPTAVVVDRERKIRGYGHPTNVTDLVRMFYDSIGDIAATTGHTFESSLR